MPILQLRKLRLKEMNSLEITEEVAEPRFKYTLSRRIFKMAEE